MSANCVVVSITEAFETLTEPRVERTRGHDLIDIVVIAKDMSFNGTNPSFVVKKGQAVRITVKNEDRPGIFHDFVIPALGLKTNFLKPGESEILLFTADREGIFNYACTLHPRLMTGKFQVQ